MSSQSQQTNPGIQKKNTLLNDLKASLKEEQTKVEKIDKIIEKLEAAKKTIISQKQGQEQESTSYSRILEKYITFLNYIKSIIEAKIEKDNKITTLQWDVFDRIDKIGESINLTKTKPDPIIETVPNNLEKNKKELADLEQKKKGIEDELNKKNKQYLLDFNASSEGEGVGLYANTGVNIEFKAAEEAALKCNVEIAQALNTFNAELKKGQSGGMTINQQRSSEMNDYTDDSKEIFSTLISVLNKGESPDNTILKNVESINNNNSKRKNTIKIKQKEHTNKLKKIKKAYEDGLQKNIDDFEAICEALKKLVETVNTKTTALKEKIDEIKRNVNASKKERDNKIKEIKDKIENNENNKKKIQELKEEIKSKEAETKQNRIMLKVLNTSFLDDVFKANHEALVGKDDKSGLLGEITKAQEGLNSAKITVQGVNVNNPSQSPAQDRGPGKQVPGQNTVPGTGNPSQGTLVQQVLDNPSQGSSQVQFQQVQARGQAQGQGNSGQKGQVNSGKQLIPIASKFFIEAKENKIDIKEIEIRQEIKKELDELEELKKVNPRNEEKIKEKEQKIDMLFIEGNYNLSDNLEEQFDKVKVPELEFTNNEKYLLLRFISLLTFSGKFEDGLQVLYSHQDSKILINKIFTTQDRGKRQKLLIDLYEQRPNRPRKGGKYKKKKSKNYKKSSKSKTSKKAKSTKKQKATRTQVKSYNNPKYKNQDGGFVRGGVLFPESFYRSDIVM